MSGRTKSRIEEISKGRANIHKLSIDDICFEWETNARTDYGDIESLARSIAQTGVLQPVKIYFKAGDPTPFASDGFRRRKAVEYARQQGWIDRNEPVFVLAMLEHPKAGKSDILFTQLVANTGKDLTPIEKSTNIRKLVDRGHSIDEIAIRACLQKQYAEKLLELSYATPKTKQLIESNRIKATTVWTAIHKLDADSAEEFLMSAVEKAESEGAKVTVKLVDSLLKEEERVSAGQEDRQGNLLDPQAGTEERHSLTDEESASDNLISEPAPTVKPFNPAKDRTDNAGQPDKVEIILTSDEKSEIVRRLSHSDYSQVPDRHLVKLNRLLDKLQIPVTRWENDNAVQA